MLQTSAGEQDLRTHPTPSSPSFGRIVAFQARAGNCSCISGIHAGQEPKCPGGHGWPREAAVPGSAGKLLLHFGTPTQRPSFCRMQAVQAPPKIAPAFSACPPSMADKIKRPTAIARGGPTSPLTACSVRAYVSDSATFATSRRSKLIGCLGKPALENACQAYAPGIGPESG